MRVTWLNILRDWFSLLVAFCLLAIPFSGYSFLVWTMDKQSQRVAIEDLASETLSDFEIILDHLNGALINLKIEYDQCDAGIRNRMHQLSFGLPGVEAFAFVDAEQRIRCTNWLRNFGNLSLELPLSNEGLNLSGEEYIGLVGKTGVLVYRSGSDGGLLVALMSSAYLRQALQQNMPTSDSMVLFNRDARKHMAMNGLINSGELTQIEHALGSQPADPQAEWSRDLFTVSSQQYPSVTVAYFYRPPTYLVALRNRLLESALFISISLIAAWGWLAYRHNKVNSIEYQIQFAIRHDEFEPYLQPIVDIQSDKWVGAEMLARWRRAGKTVAYPDEFIPAAESSNQIKALTLGLAKKLSRSIPGEVLPIPEFYFSINLSPNHLDEQTEQAIEKLVAGHRGLSRQNVRFEITEHGVLGTSKQQFQTVVKRLRQKGYLFGLDDFGTGQSGLEYFSNLTPDFLKIDRRFVIAIDKPESVDFQLLKTIVQLAQSLRLIIIAEGVETEHQMQWLKANGIRYAQGWYYDKAMPLPEFRQRLMNLR